MKKFILKCMLFITILAVVDYLSGYLFLLHNAGEEGKISKARHLAVDFSEDILILGSSRASRHFNSNLISERTGMTCFNGGFDAHGIINAYPLFKMALQRHVPKIVIYDLTPQVDCYENDNIQYTELIRPYHNNTVVMDVIKNTSALEALKCHSNLYSINSQIPEMLLLPLISSEQQLNGFQPLYGEINDTPSKNTEDIIVYGMDSVKLMYLDKMINECREQGIEFYFSVSPVYDNDIAAEAYRFPEFLSGKYNLPVLDHLQDDGFLLKNKYFYDQSHLNKFGADTLTNLLIEEILHR